MHCPICNASNDTQATFCGQCGKQLTAAESSKHAAVYASAQRGANTVWTGTEESSVKQISFNEAQPFPQDYNTRTPASSAEHSPISTPFTPYHFPLSEHKNARNIAFLAIILALVVVGLLASVLTLVQNKHLPSKNTSSNGVPLASGMQGTVSFSTSQNGQGNTDSLSISISSVEVTAGTHYAAWLVNEENEQTLALGNLQAQDQAKASKQIFMLNFMQQGINLLAIGNKLEVTRETVNATLPTGPVLLAAKFPTLAFIHIKHLLVSFPGTPNSIGLLMGMSGQAQQLHAQTLLLQQNGLGQHVTQCEAQGIINIIEGKASLPAHNCANLNVTIAGDGLGLLGQNNNGYVALSAAHASLAATQTDATDTIRKYAQQIIVTTDSLKKWLTTLDQDAHALQTDAGDTTKVQEMMTLAAYVLNGNTAIGGSSTAYRDGQLMATLTLEQLK